MSEHFEEHLLPRPVEKLPDFANAKARRTLAEKLQEAFGLSSDAATVIADSVVDPSTTRKNIGDPAEPQVEEIRVPGGVLLGIRTEVWSRLVMPDPRNPRIGPSRRHPFAVDPGTGGEDCRFRPVPEPRTPDDRPAESPELAVEVESRDHLTWASAQAAKYVLAKNNWKESIASQGVMEAVWLTATTYMHGDGAAPATVVTTVEGSSRMTAVHELLTVRSADVPYADEHLKLRGHFRKLNEAFDRGVEPDQAVLLRCERVPALIIVGFQPHVDGNTTFPTAIKSLVALRHVDPPMPWGEGPESESLADEVLDELYRRDLISPTERLYYAGGCTKAEARAAHLSDDPAERAARIVALFTGDDERVDEAIRIAVTSQSTRKRITGLLRNQLATALILRSVDGDSTRADQIRRYMRRSFGKAVHGQRWTSTGRSVDTLAEEAMKEVRAAIGDSSVTEPGPASLEIGVRATYPLVVSGRLSADRGTANNDQPDRRNPGEVVDAMRRTVQGVHQLAQALRDFPNGEKIRAVDEDGTIRKVSDGSTDQMVTDVYLREQFPAPGKVRARRSGDTPTEVFQNCLVDFSGAMEKLEESFDALGGVFGQDGVPVADSNGADPRACSEWRDTLSKIDDELNIWSRTFQRVYGTTRKPVIDESLAVDDELDVDDDYESDEDHWDSSDEDVRDEVAS